MKSGCSLSTHSGSQDLSWPLTSSSQEICLGPSSSFSPVRFSTTMRWSDGTWGAASSTFFFRGTFAPLRQPASAVSSTFAPASFIRSRSASAEKPPNTTECTAPMRAHASMAMAASGTMGM